MKNNIMKYGLLYMTLFGALFLACQQPEAPVKKPNSGPGASVSMALAELKVYDDTDKENPLTLSKSDINSLANSVAASESAEVIFIDVRAQEPAETEIDISVGSVHGYTPGVEGNGIPLTQDFLSINITVKASEIEKKTYTLSVSKGTINDIVREPTSDPIGTHAVYWNGTSLPLNTDYSPIEEAGYDTIERAWNAILDGGTGTADNPDILMLGSDISMEAVNALNIAGRHIKITVPPYKKYTISRKKFDTGEYYKGSFFKVNALNTSLTLWSEDLPGADSVISMLVLDGGAIWSAVTADDMTGGTNTVGTNADQFQPLIAVLNGGVLNMDKWVIIQNFSSTYSLTGAINVGDDSTGTTTGGGTFNMYGGKLTKNKTIVGALLVQKGGKVNMYGGSFEYNSTSGASVGGGAIYMYNVAPAPELVISGGAFISNTAHANGTVLGGGAIHVGAGSLTIANPSTLAILKRLDGTAGSYDDAPAASLPGQWLSEIENVDFTEKEPNMVFESLSSLTGLSATSSVEKYIDKIAASHFILFKGNRTKLSGGDTGGGAIMINSTDSLVGTARIFDALFEENASASHGGAINAKNKDGYVIKNVLFRHNNSATVTNDQISGGGAIRNNVPFRVGLIRLDNILFFHNTSYKGGAIYHMTPDTDTETTTKKIVITNCVFKENEAKSTTAKTGYGGAILFNDLYDDITIFASHFEKNMAKTGGGAIALRGAGPVLINGETGKLTKIVDNAAEGANPTLGTGGGGIIIHRIGTVTVDYTEIRGNTAKGAATVGAAGGGGILSTGGGGELYHSSQVLLTGESLVELKGNVVIAGNTAGDATYDTAYGGGIYNMAANGTIALSNGATVGGTAAEDANYAKKGGGIAVKGTSTSLDDESDFARLILRTEPTNPKPQVKGNGAGTISEAEKITSVGGGIYAEGHVALEIDGEVSSNKAVSGGGGVFVELNATGRITTPANFPTVALLGNALIQGNSVTEQDSTSAPPYSNGGGGIHIRRSGLASNSHVLFTMAGGAEISANSAVQGAGIYLYNVAFFADPPSSDFDTAGFVMSGGSIKDNIASSTHSGSQLMVWGGGVCLSGTLPILTPNTQSTGFYMNGGSIEGNKALGTVAAGGGVFLDKSNAKFMCEGGEIKDNEAGLCGGGVSVGSFGESSNVLGIKFVLDGGRLAGNTAGSFGGAVFMYSTQPGAFTFNSGSFENNKYTGTGTVDGHTLYLWGSGVTNHASVSLILTSANDVNYKVISGDSDAYSYSYP